jgi:hypothetical protein
MFSPPQTPEVHLVKVPPQITQVPRPETPPPSTHRTEMRESPQTPTHAPLTALAGEGSPSLFDDNGRIQPPPTPVLYNLIRKDGPQKFVAAAPPRHKDFLDDGKSYSLDQLTYRRDSRWRDTSRTSKCMSFRREVHLYLILTLVLTLPNPKNISGKASRISFARFHFP